MLCNKAFVSTQRKLGSLKLMQIRSGNSKCLPACSRVCVECSAPVRLAVSSPWRHVITHVSLMHPLVLGVRTYHIRSPTAVRALPADCQSAFISVRSLFLLAPASTSTIYKATTRNSHTVSARRPVAWVRGGARKQIMRGAQLYYRFLCNGAEP